MVEAELDLIKNKLKDDTIDVKDLEKKLLKIEKKLLQLENRINNSDTNNLELSENSSDSDCDINIDCILKDLQKLESDITNINSNISIEKLIDNYVEFKMKLNSIKLKN